MSNYIIDISDGSKTASFPSNNFSYTDKLNLTNEAVVNISGSSAATRNLISFGNEITIKRNSTIEFTGTIIGISYLDAGGLSIRCKDFAFDGAKKKASKYTYTSTASATIFTALINAWNSAYLGTIEAGVTLDFKIDNSSTYLQVISNLLQRTDQDIEKNMTTKKINIRDHKGSSTSVLTFNDYIDISNLGYDFAEPEGNVIQVYGKGDGENQIKSESSHGRNATSISAYGEIEKTEVDLTVCSVDEANTLADALANKYGSPTKTYTFQVNNPNQDIVSGDVITLNSIEKEISNENVRITGIKRGVRSGVEFLELEVCNEEYSKLTKSVNKIVSQLQSNNITDNTYSQGTTNVLTFSEMINANSSAPLRVKCYFPADFITDEVGNLRVNSFTLDYDVDPFRSGIGSASEDNMAPTVYGDSGSKGATVTGSVDYQNPHVTGNSGDYSTLGYVGQDNTSTTSCSAGSWTTVATLRPGSSYLNQSLYASIWIMGDSGGAEDIEVRIGNDAVYGYIEPGLVGSGGTVWGTYCDGFRDTSMLMSGDIGVGSVSSSTHDIFVQVRPQSGAINLSCGMSLSTIKHNHDANDYYAGNHKHDDSSLNAASHYHSDGDYYAGSHNHNVSIGDGISDSGSTNATSVNIYLDFWNGSSWVNKHSILSTGKTIDYDVDLSNGGQYPDAPGYWQVRVYSNSASPDLFQGAIKCKHELDA